MAIEDKDLLAEALARVTEQFRNKGNLADLIGVFAAEIQELQDASLVALSDINIADSEGAQLDGIGSIVGEERHGRDDDVYRLAIRARIRINLSNGTIADLIDIIRAVVGDVEVQVSEWFPAAALIEIIDALDTDTFPSGTVATLLKAGRGAGVNTQIEYHTSDIDHVFTFSSGDTEEASTAQGWADDAQTTGGHFANVVGA